MTFAGKNSRARALFSVFAIAIASFVAVPTPSVAITINVPCAGQWKFDGVSTLSCETPTGLVCNPTVTPSPSPLPTFPATISAGCSGATTWTWTADAANVGCPDVPAAQANASSITVTSTDATASMCTYKVEATDGGSKTGSASAGVKWGTPPALSNCQFSPAPSGAVAGTPLALNVVCQNGPPTNAATFTWSATPASGTGTVTFAQTAPTTSGTNSVTFSAAGTWTIKAVVATTNNNGSDVVTASFTVDPPVQTNLACTGFDNTKTLPLAWPSAGMGSTKGYTSDIGHMGPNDAVVIEFTIPAVLPANKISRLSWGEVGLDLNPRRKLVLSDQRCDFTRGLGSGSIKTGIGGSLIFSAGTNSYGYPQLLTAGRKYYINVKNDDVCSAAHCNFQVELAPPQ